MKYIAITLIILVFIGCGNNQRPSDNEIESEQVVASDTVVSLTPEQLKNTTIELASLEKINISGVLRLNGNVEIDPNNRVSLTSALGGHVKSVNALPGKSVKKGEVILTIEDNQFIQIQQDYLTTNAQLLSAEADYSRQKQLNASKSASDKAMQSAETEYLSLLAVKSALEEKLRLINIHPPSLTPSSIRRGIHILAPFNGVVSEVMINKGKYVSPSDVLVEIISLESPLLRLRVFEKDWSSVNVGQSIEAYTNQEPDKKIQAEIISTGNIINEDGSAVVIARVNAPSTKSLLPGLYVNAIIQIENKVVYTLPEDAIVSFEGKSYAFNSVNTTTFQMIEISIGNSHEGKIEIINYESLLDKSIVSKGAYTLLMAAKNNVEE